MASKELATLLCILLAQNKCPLYQAPKVPRNRNSISIINTTFAFMQLNVHAQMLEIDICEENSSSLRKQHFK